MLVRSGQIRGRRRMRPDQIITKPYDGYLVVESYQDSLRAEMFSNRYAILMRRRLIGWRTVRENWFGGGTLERFGAEGVCELGFKAWRRGRPSGQSSLSEDGLIAEAGSLEAANACEFEFRLRVFEKEGTLSKDLYSTRHEIPAKV